MTPEQRTQFQLDLITMSQQGYFYALQDSDSVDTYDAFATEHEAEIAAIEMQSRSIFVHHGITTKVVRIELPLVGEYR